MAELTEVQAIAALCLLDKIRKKRHMWVHSVLRNRSQFGKFHHLLQELRLDVERFQRYFRLNRSQFDDLLARIGGRISHQDTNYRCSIPAAERLSICLRYLATGDSFRTIGNSFCVGVSTVQGIVPEVVAAIWDCLVGDFIAVPSTAEWLLIAEGFQERWNFPHCCGALDGKHIVLKSPPKSGSQFYNYKGTFSVVLLAVVDSNYCFRVIDVGGYGRSSDGGILAHSAFGQALRSVSLSLPADCPLLGDDHRGPQPYVFAADEAFPLRKNHMRPFPGRTLPSERTVFNYRLSRAQLVVENAFGILSSQWRFLRRVIEVRPEIVEQCVKAACVLHNFIRMSSADTPARESVPLHAGEPLPGLGRVAANNHSREALRVRQTFVEYCSAEGAVPWQPHA